MNLWESLRRTKPDHWIDALWWLILSSIGGLLPIWGLVFFLLMFSQKVSIDIITKNGEFALYSAATLSSGLYIITKEDGWGFIRRIRKSLSQNRKSKPPKGGFPGHRLFLSIAILGIMLSIFIFSGAIFPNLPGVNLSTNTNLIKVSSISLFIVATITSYIITALDISEGSLTEEDLSKDENALIDEFDALEKE
jgi:hypothetical protein